MAKRSIASLTSVVTTPNAALREQGVLIIGSGMSFHEINGTYAQSAAFLWH